MTTSTLAPSPRLTHEQVSDYQREGYLIFDQPVLPQAKFDALKAYFEKILGELPSGERPEAMDVPHFMHPKLLEWAFDDAILDLVQPIVGEDVVLFSTHFICKPKGNGRRVPWHEDSAYWKGVADPMEICTVWLAIDPSIRENGCMQVIPRTHRTGSKGFSSYVDVDKTQNVFPTEIAPEQRQNAQRIAIELQPNQCSLHDARIMHGSEPNTSNLRRCGWTMRFASSAVKFSQQHFNGGHQVYLARGRDLGGNVYADPTKSYPEIMKRRGGSSRYKNSH